MKQNLEFIAQLNIIAIVSKAIHIINKCYKDECEKRNLVKDRELLDYTPFPEECNYDEFYTIVELRRVASPLIVADMIVFMARPYSLRYCVYWVLALRLRRPLNIYLHRVTYCIAK